MQKPFSSSLVGDSLTGTCPRWRVAGEEGLDHQDSFPVFSVIFFTTKLRFKSAWLLLDINIVLKDQAVSSRRRSRCICAGVQADPQTRL